MAAERTPLRRDRGGGDHGREAAAAADPAKIAAPATVRTPASDTWPGRDIAAGTAPARVTVVGCLADGTLGCGVDGASLFAAATAIYGSVRLLEAVGAPRAKRVAWPTPFADGIEAVAAAEGPVVVLATGDPLHFGVGGTLAARVPAGDLAIIPAPSAFSLAAARMVWRLEEVVTLSLHRSSPRAVLRHAAPGVRLLAVTKNADTPAEVARHLKGAGLGASRITVFDAMGTAGEQRMTFCAADGPPRRPAALNTLAIACRASADGAGRSFSSRAPGLPDEAFVHDGQLTKQDVRAITVAALEPGPGARLWDVGAGCGSVAIEWLRAATWGGGYAAAVAFERSAGRLAMLRENAARFGLDDALAIVEGEAAAALDARGGKAPDVAFLGGGVADDALFDRLWRRLTPGGRLVSNAVTLEGEAATLARHARHGGTLVRIDIAVSEPVGEGRLTALKPRMPVLQWRVTKPADAGGGEARP